MAQSPSTTMEAALAASGLTLTSAACHAAIAIRWPTLAGKATFDMGNWSSLKHWEHLPVEQRQGAPYRLTALVSPVAAFLQQLPVGERVRRLQCRTVLLHPARVQDGMIQKPVLLTDRTRVWGCPRCEFRRVAENGGYIRCPEHRLRLAVFGHAPGPRDPALESSLLDFLGPEAECQGASPAEFLFPRALAVYDTSIGGGSPTPWSPSNADEEQLADRYRALGQALGPASGPVGPGLVRFAGYLPGGAQTADGRLNVGMGFVKAGGCRPGEVWDVETGGSGYAARVPAWESEGARASGLI